MGSRIVIPLSMRQKVLGKVHDGHLGVNKCLDRAAATVWRPGTTTHIKLLINQCEHCQVKQRMQAKEPLWTTPMPDGPWQHISADLCEFEGQDYLVIADYYKRWIEVLHLRHVGGVKDTTATAIISKFKDVFSRFRVPFEVWAITDHHFNHKSSAGLLRHKTSATSL